MSVPIGFLIFLSSLITLAFEFFLYFSLGFGAFLSHGFQGITTVAGAFICLMLFTGSMGLLAPVAAIIELATGKPNFGNKIFVVGGEVSLLVVVILWFKILAPGNYSEIPSETSIPKKSISQPETPIFVASPSLEQNGNTYSSGTSEPKIIVSASQALGIPEEGSVQKGQEVFQFIMNWANAEKLGDLEKILSCYANPVRVYFNQKDFDRDKLRKDKDRFISNYPKIPLYEISDFKIAAESKEEVTVVFNKKWKAIGKKVFIGEEIQKLVLLRVNGGFQILEEHETNILFTKKTDVTAEDLGFEGSSAENPKPLDISQNHDQDLPSNSSTPGLDIEMEASKAPFSQVHEEIFKNLEKLTFAKLEALVKSTNGFHDSKGEASMLHCGAFFFPKDKEFVLFIPTSDAYDTVRRQIESLILEDKVRGDMEAMKENGKSPDDFERLTKRMKAPGQYFDGTFIAEVSPFINRPGIENTNAYIIKPNIMGIQFSIVKSKSKGGFQKTVSFVFFK